jgi:hypothetical protein
VEETTARIEKEQAEQDARMQETPPKSDESIASLLSKHPCKLVHPWKNKHEGVVPRNKHLGQMVDPCLNREVSDSHETDKRAKRTLTDLQRDQQSRVQNPSLLLCDLRELGMYGELSEDNCHINMPFEDVHCLVTTMTMAELILNERVQTSRKAKMAEIKIQLDVEHCPNMSVLLVELI